MYLNSQNHLNQNWTNSIFFDCWNSVGILYNNNIGLKKKCTYIDKYL